MSRRQQIEAMLQESPDDKFLLYALALELEKENEFDQSQALFEKLMSGDPPYVPAYFMSAQMLCKLDRFEDARRIIVSGIQQATQQNDDHAAREMSEFLETIPEE